MVDPILPTYIQYILCFDVMPVSAVVEDKVSVYCGEHQLVHMSTGVFKQL